MTRRARAYQARVRARRARAGSPPLPADAAAGSAPDGGSDGGSDGAASPQIEPAGGPELLRATPVGLFPLAAGPVQVVHGEAFTVRPVTGAAAVKAYTCPWCLQVIAPRVPHVVAWPVQNRLDGTEGLSVRRHWHRHCWASSVRTAASGRRR